MLLFISCLGSLLWMVGCGEKVTPTISPSGTSAKPTPLTGIAREWDALVAAAQKEGKVALYAGSAMPNERVAVIKTFKEKYGIDIEYVTGPSNQVAEKLAAETRARLNIADVGMFGLSTLVSNVKPLGILEPLEPLLVLPEVTDPAQWHRGKIPYFWSEGQPISVSVIWSTARMVTINTKLVKPGEIKSYDDLLAPKWKGQIIFNDPTGSGGGNVWFGVMLRYVKGMETGLAFMRELAKQEPIISRDNRQMVEWLAKGKYPMAIGINTASVNEFIALGAPVARPLLKEPQHVSSGTPNIIAFKNAPHPNAKKLFVNWFLSKDGASIIALNYHVASLRKDIFVEGLHPDLIPTPEDILLDEDYYKWQSEIPKLANEIFAAQLK